MSILNRINHNILFFLSCVLFVTGCKKENDDDPNILDLKQILKLVTSYGKVLTNIIIGRKVL